MATNKTTATAREYIVSVALPKKAGVYAARFGGGISTQVADVTIDAGDLMLDAVIYGRLASKNGQPAMDLDLTPARGVRISPEALPAVNAAVETAAKTSPFWEQMKAKAFTRLLSGATETKVKAFPDAFVPESQLVKADGSKLVQPTQSK